MPDGLLIIRRTTQWVAIARRFRLYVDGQFVGRIAAGGELQLPLPAGEHLLDVRLDWVSRTLDVFVRDGESTEIEVRSRLGWLWCVAYAQPRVVGFPVVAGVAGNGGTGGAG